MTTTNSLENPLLDKWEEVWGIKWQEWMDKTWIERMDLEHDVWRRSHRSLDETLSHYRDDRRHKYSWAIPTPTALELVASYAPIVEIGAGVGYWASLLRQMGVEVKAYDSSPLPEENHWHMYADPKPWTEVEKGYSDKAGHYPDHTLFLCWPPMSDMACHAILTYKEAGGKRVIYIGESDGGCTASAEFHDELNENWQETVTLDIPQWAGLHDYLSVWERNGTED